MKNNYRPDWTYADFASQFTAEFYDPDHWADVFEASGAKYELFCLQTMTTHLLLNISNESM